MKDSIKRTKEGPFIDLLTPPEPCLRGRNHPSLNILSSPPRNANETSITFIITIIRRTRGVPSRRFSLSSIESAF